MTAVGVEDPARIAPWELLTDALGRLRGAWLTVLIVAAGPVALPLLLHYLPIELKLGLVLQDEVNLARSVMRVVLEGLLGAVLVPALVADRKGRAGLGGYLECAAILLAFGAAPLALAQAMTALLGPYGGSEVLGFALTLLIAYVGMRVFLWPIARRVGRAGVTPAVAWRLTRGSVIAYFVAILGVAAPCVVLMLVLEFRTSPGSPELVLALSRLLGTGIQALTWILGIALSAAVFDRRLGAREGVAEVFA